jgi:Methyltransferase domain
MSKIKEIDEILCSDRWSPYSGFHDDHRAHDGTEKYLPAMQQVRAEFVALIDVIEEHLPRARRCLQLGIGATDASHAVWLALFDEVVSIDFGRTLIDAKNIDDQINGFDTHAPDARALAEQFCPYDMLFIDAGHEYQDVMLDFERFSPLVRSGGIIGFHDALKRTRYEEIAVWQFLETLENVNMIGSEVGIAYLLKV